MRSRSTSLLGLDQGNLSFVGDDGLVRVHGQLRDGGFGKIHEGARADGIGLGDDERNAAVAADTDRLIQRQAAEERNAQLSGGLLASAVTEDVGDVMTVGAFIET